jgi:hypothetical protein
MSVKLTGNFLATARGITLLDGTGITWSIDQNTNEITGDTGAGGAVAANPTAKVGIAAVNGSAATWMRSDAAPPIDLTANYAWSGHVGWFGSTAIAQPTTGVAAAVFAQVDTTTPVSEDSTFDGYTLRQVVKALRNLGLLA